MSIDDNLLALEHRVLDAFHEGGKEAVEELKRLSQAVVPVDMMDLHNSATATFTPTAEGFRGSVTYDGPYAARQHEEVDWRHDPGRQAKYLGGPLRANSDRLQEHITEKVKRVFGG